MRWKKPAFPYRRFAALAKSRRRHISGSASRCWPSSGSRSSSSGGVASMTALTWIPGWTNISAEGGPGRRQKNNGP